MFDEKIDVLEDELLRNNSKLLNLLLKDKTTKRNIIWATGEYYKLYSSGYEPYQEIRVASITEIFGSIIKPRVAKDLDRQIARTKNHAEVFTPAWICNIQNNLIDEDWFERKGVFNLEKGKDWETTRDHIIFEGKERTWKHYIDTRRLEVSCGEAPYLVSRYDQATGKPIEVINRIGLLDRKLRVVCENATSHEEWCKWALRALQSVYGFEYQGDNLLLARENILYTFIDYYRYCFHGVPSHELLLKAANIIVWNIWQMDGLTNKPPQISSNPESTSRNQVMPTCLIKNWREKKTLSFDTLTRAK